jgi:hypothetical protein
MAISLKHNFQSAVADEGDASLVRPSNWNAEHNLTLATSRLVGRTTAGTGSAEEISVGTGLSLNAGSLAVSSTTPQVNSINTFTVAQVVSATDNSNPALRITQLGTADALRVEDETSPDATPFVITANGHAIAGYGSALTIETVVPQFQSHTDVLAEGGFGGVDWGNTATGQVNWFGKSRGGSYGAQGILSSGDTIGDFRFYGSDGVGLIPAAKIEVEVDGTPGVNDMPGRIGFFTTADGAATSTERFRIGNAGQWGIGGATYGTSGQAFLSGGASAAPSWGDVARPGVSNTFTANQIIEVTDNTNAALRITQLGTGDAIRVEDSTTPDSTSFRVDQNGAVTAGGAITSGGTITLPATSNMVWSGRGNLTSPAAGGIQLGQADLAAPVAQTLSAQSVVAGTADTAGQALTIRGSRGTGTGAGGIIALQTAPAGTTGTAQNAAVERMRINSAGDVGIGTSGPAGKLHVNGGRTFLTTASADSYVLNLRNPTYTNGCYLGNPAEDTFAVSSQGGTERFRIASAGQIGIGGANYGTSGQFIKSAGSAAAPTWASIANTDISGLGTMSTQNASSVSITGGSITGITDLAVADGGTGASSFTAYSVVVGGTTSTGPLQNVVGVGTSGQVLTSNGAGTLPSWQTSSAATASDVVTLALILG